MEMSLAENMILKSSYDAKWQQWCLLDRPGIAAHTQTKITDYSIKAPGPDAVVKELSGGNQQKLIVAREVDNGKRLIIFDQPTRGLDLGAIDYVHKTILALSDRIAVLYRGSIQGIFKKTELTIEAIGLLMAGYTLKGPAPDRTKESAK